MAYATPERNYGPLVLIIFLAMILLTAYVLAFIGLLDSLPLTQHAQNAHQGQAINASTLIDDISNNRCKRLEVYQCPDGTIKILCKLSSNTWGGLILGINSHGDYAVITGYGGRKSYWEINVQGCQAKGDFLLP